MPFAVVFRIAGSFDPIMLKDTSGPGTGGGMEALIIFVAADAPFTAGFLTTGAYFSVFIGNRINRIEM